MERDMTAPNPLGSFPVPSLNDRYRMGPGFAEAPDLDYWWNYQWPDGTYTACAEPSGWESLNYITPIDQVGGRDGGLIGPQSVAPRQIELEAAIVAPDAPTLRTHIARIRRLFGPTGLPGPRDPIVWEQYDYATGRRLALITRPSGDMRFSVVPGTTEGGVAAVASATLIAANPPWKFQSGAAAEFVQVGLTNPALISGRTYDKTFNYTYGAATSPGGEMIAINGGDLAAYPVFTVTGDVDLPIITNITTGLSFQVNKTLAAGEVVTIDADTGVVTPASVRLIGRPFPLAPGANTIRWRSASGTYYPAALLRLDWRSTSR
jgi:hypothetical protein